MNKDEISKGLAVLHDLLLTYKRERRNSSRYEYSRLSSLIELERTLSENAQLLLSAIAILDHQDSLTKTDFSEYPESLAARSAEKDWDATKWTPRDALIDTLRRIDAKEIDVVDVVISFSVRVGDKLASGFTASVQDPLRGLGIIQATSQDMRGK